MLFFFFPPHLCVLAWACSPRSDDRGLHLPHHNLTVNARLILLLLPVAVGGHLGHDDAPVLLQRRQAAGGTGQLHADGGAAGFGEGGAAVAEVVADHRLPPPAELAAVGPPLSPLAFDSCLGLWINTGIQPMQPWFLFFRLTWIQTDFTLFVYSFFNRRGQGTKNNVLRKRRDAPRQIDPSATFHLAFLIQNQWQCWPTYGGLDIPQSCRNRIWLQPSAPAKDENIIFTNKQSAL